MNRFAGLRKIHQKNTVKTKSSIDVAIQAPGSCFGDTSTMSTVVVVRMRRIISASVGLGLHDILLTLLEEGMSEVK